MNLLQVFSRGLVVTGLVTIGNVSAIEFTNRLRKRPDIVFVSAGSLLKEDILAKLLGEEKISPRNQLIIGKAALGAAGNLIKHLDQNEVMGRELHTYMAKTMKMSRTSDDFVEEGKPYCYAKGVGYFVINGSLRVAGDYVSLNEETIDKKCDEVLSENVAWAAKPLATAALDLAYNSATIAILVGILDGYNKS